MGHHQYPTLLPRFYHRCHPRSGCGGHHSHHFPRFPQSGRHHPRSYHLHGRGPFDRGCSRAAVWLRTFPLALPLESARGLGNRKSGASSWANLKTLNKVRVGARIICPKAEVLSRRA